MNPTFSAFSIKIGQHYHKPLFGYFCIMFVLYYLIPARRPQGSRGRSITKSGKTFIHQLQHRWCCKHTGRVIIGLFVVSNTPLFFPNPKSHDK
jgi:hypothetical protein